MIPYQKLLKYLKRQHYYPVSVKKKYLVISVPGSKYHITVFQDQWDNYEKIAEKPYHLFHISSDETEKRCSSYFWVNKRNYRIQNIPRNFFLYNQPEYSFFSSTRSPCELRSIQPLLKIFQKLLNRIPIKN